MLATHSFGGIDRRGRVMATHALLGAITARGVKHGGLIRGGDGIAWCDTIPTGSVARRNPLGVSG